MTTILLQKPCSVEWQTLSATESVSMERLRRRSASCNTMPGTRIVSKSVRLPSREYSALDLRSMEEFASVARFRRGQSIPHAAVAAPGRGGRVGEGAGSGAGAGGGGVSEMAELHYDLKGGLCILAAGGGYLRLEFFKGASLPDPQRLPEGPGKAGGRHINPSDPGAAGRTEVRGLLQAAINLDLGRWPPPASPHRRKPLPGRARLNRKPGTPTRDAVPRALPLASA